jgi:hypothetical protein
VPVEIGIGDVRQDLPGERGRGPVAVAGEDFRRGNADAAQFGDDSGFDGKIVVALGAVFGADERLKGSGNGER